MARFSTAQIIVILTVISAAMLQLIDSSIVNVALTQMMGNLGASFEEIGWVITSYAISNVIMITLSGWMSAKFGRKYYFAASVVIFTFGSILCGLSDNVWELVFFRFLQGIGGGGLLSTAQAIIVETFPKEDLGMATAIYGVGVIVGPTIGPTLGGYITDNLSWQWIFFVNVPFGILATILTLTFVKEPDEKAVAGKMDWTAFTLLIAFICSLQVVLEKGQSEDWFDTQYITILTIVAVVSAVLFTWRELAVKVPIVNLRLFNNRPFALGTLFNLILGFGLFGSTLIIPIYAQSILGLSAMQTGLVMLPGSLATAVAMPIVGFALRKNWVHPAVYAGAGLLLFFVFCNMMSHLNTEASSADFFTPLIIRGFAMGLIFTPLTSISLAFLKGVEIPQGTAISNMIRQLGGSIGIALITTFITIQTAQHYADLDNNITATNPNLQQRITGMAQLLMSRGYDMESARRGAYAAIEGSMMRQATMLTYIDVFIYIGVFFIAIIPLLLLFRSKKEKVNYEVDMTAME